MPQSWGTFMPTDPVLASSAGNKCLLTHCTLVSVLNQQSQIDNRPDGDAGPAC
jgi:hypothetical protein